MAVYLAKADSFGLTLSKAAGIRPLNRERKAIRLAEKKVRKLWAAHFKAEAKSLIEQIEKVRPEREKLDAEELVAQVMRKLMFDPGLGLVDAMEEVFRTIAVDAVGQGFRQIGGGEEAIVEQANEKAVEWAKARAAELVGMKYDADGKLVANDGWAIPETTRERVRSLVTQAEAEGWANDRLADALREDYAFSGNRAEVIARTETAFADVSGNMIAYRESGLVSGKRWILANHGDESCCDDCDAAASAGVIGLDDDFPGGVDAPPAHPNCRCDVVPVLRQ